jgi:hypothetical protein
MDWLRRLFGLHVHNWGEWKYAGKIVRVKDEAEIGFIQSRECHSCKLRQFKRDYVL